MGRAEILRRIATVITATEPTIDSRRIADDGNTLRSLGINSLGLVRLMSNLEDEFQITISDAEAITAPTLRSMIDLIERKTSTPTGTAR